MKNSTNTGNSSLRFGAWGSMAGLLLLLVGCAFQRIVWSPDGRQAAVLAGDGLHLCDGEGNITDLLLTNVTTVAWFKDSRRLAIAWSESVTNWNGLSSRLNPQALETLRRDAAQLLAALQAGDPKTVLESAKREAGDNLFAARLLCLRDEHGDAALKFLKGAPQLKDLKADVSLLAVAVTDPDRIELGTPLAAELEIHDIRVSPNSAAIAFTASSGKAAHLSVVEVSGREPAKLVATPAARFPDWAPDGRSLVYITSADTNAGSGDVLLAVLSRRQVLGEDGRVELRPAPEELAGLLFNGDTKVRCLSDGRILFASEEWRLPVTTNDLPQRQQLFALDPERQSTLTRLVPRGSEEQLPENLSDFEVSPDGKRVVVGGSKSQVAVLTLASGNVEVVQPGGDTDLKSIPCWRSATELCYVAVPTGSTNQPSEVALWQNGKIRILSGHWPERVRKGLLE